MGSGCCKNALEDIEVENNKAKIDNSGNESLNTTFSVLEDNYESIPNLLNK